MSKFLEYVENWNFTQKDETNTMIWKSGKLYVTAANYRVQDLSISEIPLFTLSSYTHHKQINIKSISQSESLSVGKICNPRLKRLAIADYKLQRGFYHEGNKYISLHAFTNMTLKLWFCESIKTCPVETKDNLGIILSKFTEFVFSILMYLKMWDDQELLFLFFTIDLFSLCSTHNHLVSLF